MSRKAWLCTLPIAGAHFMTANCGIFKLIAQWCCHAFEPGACSFVVVFLPSFFPFGCGCFIAESIGWHCSFCNHRALVTVVLQNIPNNFRFNWYFRFFFSWLSSLSYHLTYHYLSLWIIVICHFMIVNYHWLLIFSTFSRALIATCVQNWFHGMQLALGHLRLQCHYVTARSNQISDESEKQIVILKFAVVWTMGWTTNTRTSQLEKWFDLKWVFHYTSRITLTLFCRLLCMYWRCRICDLQTIGMLTWETKRAEEWSTKEKTGFPFHCFT